jgi:hypothetical protein
MPGAPDKRGSVSILQLQYFDPFQLNFYHFISVTPETTA